MFFKNERELLCSMTIVSILSFCTLAQDCAQKHQIKAGDTCWKLQNDNHISNEAFMAANPGVDCAKLQIGKTLCIPTSNVGTGSTDKPSKGTGSTDEPSKGTGSTDEPGNSSSTDSPNTTGGQCKNMHKIEAGDTCWKLQNDNHISNEEFMAANPGVDCAKLQIGKSVCIPGGGNSSSTSGVDSTDKPCKQTDQPPMSTVGSEQATDKNDREKSGKCSKTYKIKKGDTCHKIQEENHISKESFSSANPGLNCDKLEVGKEVCLKK